MGIALGVALLEESMMADTEMGCACAPFMIVSAAGFCGGGRQQRPCRTGSEVRKGGEPHAAASCCYLSFPLEDP